MTSTIAVIGKSGSGKTTIVKALYNVIKAQFMVSEAENTNIIQASQKK